MSTQFLVLSEVYTFTIKDFAWIVANEPEICKKSRAEISENVTSFGNFYGNLRLFSCPEGKFHDKQDTTNCHHFDTISLNLD